MTMTNAEIQHTLETLRQTVHGGYHTKNPAPCPAALCVMALEAIEALGTEWPAGVRP